MEVRIREEKETRKVRDICVADNGDGIGNGAVSSGPGLRDKRRRRRAV